MTNGHKVGTTPGRKPLRKHPASQPVSRSPVGLVQAETLLLQRAVADPATASPADMLALQRDYGNGAVSGLIQAKLTVGAVGDRYEQEADRVAEQVMSMGEPAGAQQAVQRQEEEEELQMKPLAATITPLVQRQEEEEELQMKPLIQRQEEEEELQMKPDLQRQEEDEEELMMRADSSRQAQADGSFEASSGLESRLAVQKGGGRPLPEEVRADMEPRFGADFSGVRLHTGGEALQMNRALRAQAFTHGQDIYLRPDRYTPDSEGGRRLLAHELTHVIQQSGASGRIQRWGGPGDTTSHVQVTKDAFSALDSNIEMWYSPDAQSYLAHMSEQMDQRAGFLVGSYVPGQIYGISKSTGAWMGKVGRKTKRGLAKAGRVGWRGLRRGLGWLGEKAGKVEGSGLERAVMGQLGGPQRKRRGFWGKLWGGIKGVGSAIGEGALASLALPAYGLAKGTQWLGKKTGISGEQWGEHGEEEEERTGETTASEKQRKAVEYDQLKTYWRSSSEAPNHGEGGLYKGNGSDRDEARVNDYVAKAVAAYDSKNPRRSLATLALGLHAAEDRGAHGDGRPGTGHDPRRTSPPPNEYATSTYYQQSLAIHGEPWQGKWCDNKAKNPDGYDVGVRYGKQVLESFVQGIGVKAGEEEEEPSQREKLRRGGRLAGFKKPGWFKKHLRKAGMFFGKGAIR